MSDATPGPRTNCSIFGPYTSPTQFYGWMEQRDPLMFNKTAVREWANQSVQCLVASGCASR